MKRHRRTFLLVGLTVITIIFTLESDWAAANGDVDYTTDGLRVVLVFGDRPASLSTIDFFDWERLADYR